MMKAVYLHIDMHENQSMNYQSEFSIATQNAGYNEKEVDDPYDGNMQTTSWMSVEELPLRIKTIKIKTRTM